MMPSGRQRRLQTGIVRRLGGRRGVKAGIIGCERRHRLHKLRQLCIELEPVGGSDLLQLSGRDGVPIGDRHMIDTPHDVDLQIISGARKPELVCRDTAGKIEFTGWPRIAGEAIDDAVLTATAPELIVIIAAAALQQIVAASVAAACSTVGPLATSADGPRPTAARLLPWPELSAPTVPAFAALAKSK